MTEMSTADTYILMMEISLPKGLLCNEYIKNVRKDVGKGKLDELAAILEQNVEREGAEMLKRDAEVMAKRGKLFRSFGLLELGDEFPRKRSVL